MPIVTITVRKPKTSEFKNTVLDAIGAALVGAGASPDDRFQRVISSIRIISASIRRFRT